MFLLEEGMRSKIVDHLENALLDKIVVGLEFELISFLQSKQKTQQQGQKTKKRVNDNLAVVTVA